MKRIAVLALLFASPAFAQTLSGMIPLSPSQNGLAITTATSLTIPATANYVTICARGGAANYETDGTTTPTGTVGTTLAAGACVAFSGSKVLQNFQAIQQSGNTTTLDIKYYRY